MNERLPSLNKKFLSVVSLQDEDEFSFWRCKTPLERLEAVEINREMVYGNDKVTSRLQRFFEVAELL